MIVEKEWFASLATFFVTICIYLFLPQIPAVSCEQLSVLCSTSMTEWIAILIVFAIAIMGTWWMTQRDKKRTYGKRLEDNNMNLNYVDVPKNYNSPGGCDSPNDC